LNSNRKALEKPEDSFIVAPPSRTTNRSGTPDAHPAHHATSLPRETPLWTVIIHTAHPRSRQWGCQKYRRNYQRPTGTSGSEAAAALQLSILVPLQRRWVYYRKMQTFRAIIRHMTTTMLDKLGPWTLPVVWKERNPRLPKGMYTIRHRYQQDTYYQSEAVAGQPKHNVPTPSYTGFFRLWPQRSVAPPTLWSEWILPNSSWKDPCHETRRKCGS
jgi:hypothetical protein